MIARPGPALSARALFLVLLLSAGGTIGAAVPAARAAADAALERSLMKLEPETRLVQICDVAGLTTIAQSKSFPKVDRVLIDAVSPPKHEATRLSGDGGALRQHDGWVRFSYVCMVPKGALKASSFTFQISGAIPKDDWADLGLW